jgi:hypothetical protein
VVELFADAMREPHLAFGAIQILMLMFMRCGPGSEATTSIGDMHVERRRAVVESFSLLDEFQDHGRTSHRGSRQTTRPAALRA